MNNLGPTPELTLQALHDLNYFYYVFGPAEKNVATSREYFDDGLPLLCSRS